MNFNDAEKSIGSIVQVHLGVYGSYIGEIISASSYMTYSVNLKILACTKYPSQNAIIFTNKIFERMPLTYGSIEHCLIEFIEPFDGPLPDYYVLIKDILSKTYDMDPKLYKKHCKYWGIA